jgi:hypothetical protein
MIMEALSSIAWTRFRAACRDPLRAQAARLRHVLRSAAQTGFGRAHGFARISDIADPRELIRAYQAAVPVRDAAAMHDDLAAVYDGAWQRLCATPPLWFSMTAGSTGRYKYIPVTAAYRREVASSSLIFQGAFNACFPALRGCRTQFLVGSAEGGRSPAGVPQGFASGFNYRHLPRLLRRRFVVPYWVFTLADPLERAYAAGRILVDTPRLGVLAAISPVNLINLRRALDSNAGRLLRDVHDGTLTVHGESAVPGTWRAAPAPPRARRLRESLRDGRFPTRLLFPSLQVLVCWQGGNMGYYLDELQCAFGIHELFEFPVSASEGVFAIPFRANRPGGILAVTSHFFEFLPDGAAADAAGAAAALRADELEVGQAYRIIITNGGGLYRYDMEDVIRVTERFRDTPVIEFISKAARQVSVSNERLTELDVTEAMLQACRRRGCRFEEFLFVPCSDSRYRVVLDGAGMSTEQQCDSALSLLAAELESALRQCSKGYDFEREDGLLAPLEVLVTAPDQLRAYLAEQRAVQSLPSAQLKPQHLTTEVDAHERLTTQAAYAV